MDEWAKAGYYDDHDEDGIILDTIIRNQDTPQQTPAQGGYRLEDYHDDEEEVDLLKAIIRGVELPQQIYQTPRCIS